VAVASTTSDVVEHAVVLAVDEGEPGAADLVVGLADSGVATTPERVDVGAGVIEVAGVGPQRPAGGGQVLAGAREQPAECPHLLGAAALGDPLPHRRRTGADRADAVLGLGGVGPDGNEPRHDVADGRRVVGRVAQRVADAAVGGQPGHRGSPPKIRSSAS
jgi:hypothetical protein